MATGTSVVRGGLEPPTHGFSNLADQNQSSGNTRFTESPNSVKLCEALTILDLGVTYTHQVPKNLESISLS